jgi:hypothetical protein
MNFSIAFSFNSKELGSRNKIRGQIEKMMKDFRGFGSGQVAEQTMG